MPKNPELPQGYITLKEAGKISGYAPDYVGQLIRKGRLSGRQIYYNTAWVTTESAVQEYLTRENGQKNDASEGTDAFHDRVQRVKNQLLSEVRLLSAVRLLLYIGLAVGLLFALFLFYILSVSINGFLDKRAVEQALENPPAAAIPRP